MPTAGASTSSIAASPACERRAAPLPPQCAGLKFFNVYGPNEYHKGSMQSVVARNFEAVQRGEPLRLFRSGRRDYADGGQLRDFIYVHDCVDVDAVAARQSAGVRAVQCRLRGRRAAGSTSATRCSAPPPPPLIEFIDMPAALVDKYQYFTEARVERLRAAGYARPFTTLEAGIEDYVRGYLLRADPYR